MKGIPIRVTLALASLGAAVIHFLVTPQHFKEHALFGVFFLLLGTFQAAWAGAALLKPNMLVLASGVIASAAVVAIWAFSRTVGLPIGPDAGTPEPVALTDSLATGLEALIVLAGAALLFRRPQPQPIAEVETAQREQRVA